MGIIQFGAALAPSWDDPIAILLACHGKIRRYCQELEQLADVVAKHGWDARSTHTAQRIVHYFEVAVPLHHMDESEDFFPALRTMLSDIEKKQLDDLEKEHDSLAQSWCLVCEQLQTNIKIPDKSIICHFTQQYILHIESEEPWLQKADACLDVQTHMRLGIKMSNRRK